MLVGSVNSHYGTGYSANNRPQLKPQAQQAFGGGVRLAPGVTLETLAKNARDFAEDGLARLLSIKPHMKDLLGDMVVGKNGSIKYMVGKKEVTWKTLLEKLDGELWIECNGQIYPGKLYQSKHGSPYYLTTNFDKIEVIDQAKFIPDQTFGQFDRAPKKLRILLDSADHEIDIPGSNYRTFQGVEFRVFRGLDETDSRDVAHVGQLELLQKVNTIVQREKTEVLSKDAANEKRFLGKLQKLFDNEDKKMPTRNE
jgi:hypothetical protein